MSWLFIISMIVIGLLLLMVELFLLPGSTVAGVVGAIIIVVGNVCSYLYLGVSTGNITLITSLIISGIMLYIGTKSMGSKMALHYDLDQSKVETASRDLPIYPGDTGIAVSDLRPTGDAIINDRKFFVTSIEGYIPDNSPIEIVAINRSTIQVKKAKISVKV